MRDRTLVVSDVDGTLLGDDLALRQLRNWHDRRAAEVTLVYSSGRFYSSLLASIESTELPTPTAIIGGVGTDVHMYGSLTPLKAWHQTFARWHAARREALSAFVELEPQPDEFQSDHKLSYYAYGLDGPTLRRLEQALDEADCAAKIVYSSQRDLDVLPRTADKGTAARFIAQHLGFAPHEVVVCGDSGNDLAMFQQPDFRGVVVANAHPELKALRGPRVFHASQGYAAGVLQGLQHWRGETVFRQAQ